MTHSSLPHGVELLGAVTPEYSHILTTESLDFIARLHREFRDRRAMLLEKRLRQQGDTDSGVMPSFLSETESVRRGDWRVASIPNDLQRRHVEITGPTERKMMINALNSGADVFMADFEDANSPTWDNMIQGHLNLRDAIERTISFKNPDGKEYKLNDKVALLLVRPRGWHLTEKHLLIDGQPISASLFDFGLYFFHNARRLLDKGSGPYFYLPKLESHLEARLWNDVFNFAQDELKISRGTIKATVLIETILAAFEMEEILYELRDHAAGLNAGRWDYIFSTIKKFCNQPDFLLPDRSQITMTVPFMRAYTELLVKTCHTRGAHAIGGMAAFIPSRKDAQVNETAIAKVREDKLRESGDGFDGTWVAHPDLVPTAKEVFDGVLGDTPHQKDKLRLDVQVAASQLINFKIPNGTITENGLRNNISVGIQYIESWLRGNGAVAINNLMEDAATAEISRAQVWQWLHHTSAALDDGRKIDLALYKKLLEEELSKIKDSDTTTFKTAAKLFDELVTAETFKEFLTIPAYQCLT
ncbi:MAG: malate synthase A [Chloroflexi bacterium]|nr:malate synthase A [Chloroflexota bacterium]